MRAIVKSYDEGPDCGLIELETQDGYHTGTTITVFLSEVDAVPVVVIDTPKDTETHEEMRVYVNDALVSGREVAASQS